MTKIKTWFILLTILMVSFTTLSGVSAYDKKCTVLYGGTFCFNGTDILGVNTTVYASNVLSPFWLNLTDQRYNDTAYIISTNASMKTYVDNTFYLKSNPYNFLNSTSPLILSIISNTSTSSGVISSLVTNTTVLQTTTASLVTNTSTLQTTTSSLVTNTSKLQTTTSSLVTNTTNLQSNVGSLVTNVTNLQGNVNSLSTNVSTLQTTTGSLVTNTSTLQTTSASLVTNTSALQTTTGSLVSNLTTEISNRQTNDTALGSRIDAVNSTATGKASPGNCPDGQVVMNTTTSGVQCVSVTATNAVNASYASTSNYSQYVNISNVQSLNDTSLILAVNNNVTTLQTTTGSLVTNTTNLQTTTGSLVTNTSTLQTTSASLVTNTTALQTTTGSLVTNTSTLQTTSASLVTNTSALQTTTGSLVTNLSTETSDRISNDSLKVAKAGDTMTGNLVMGTNSLNFTNVSFRQLSQNSNIDGGVIGVMMTNPPGVESPHVIFQSGGSTQASVLVRSVMIQNENTSFQNSVNATDCNLYMNSIGEVLKIDCNTSTSGADLLVSDDMQVVGDVWLKDSQGEWHYMTKELTSLDYLQENTVAGDVETFSNSSNFIVYNANSSTTLININSNNYIIAGNLSVALNSGSNESPAYNYITIQGNGTLTNDASYPSAISHIDIARIIRGQGHDYLYLLIPTKTQDFVYNSYDVSINSYEKYISGFTPVVNATNLNLSSGEYWNSLLEFESNNALSMNSNGFFVVLNNGSFVQCSVLSCLTQYNDGGSIAANAYFNVVWAVLPDSSNTSRLVAIPQNTPAATYTTVGAAEQDASSTITFSINNAELTKHKLILIRTIVRNSNDQFQAFTGGAFYKNIVGLPVSGTAAGGTNDHSLLTNLDYASSGHTGFASSSDITNLNNTKANLVGNNVFTGTTYINQTLNIMDGAANNGTTIQGNTIWTGTLYVVNISSANVVNPITVNGSYIPILSDTFYLGNSSRVWKEVWGTNLYGNINASYVQNPYWLNLTDQRYNDSASISTQSGRIDTLNSTKALAGASAACTYGVANVTLNAQAVPSVTCAEAQGDITSVVAGTGLTGGATSGDATLNWNATYGATALGNWSGDKSLYYNNTDTFSRFVNRSNWTTIDNYPAACGAGTYATTIGDTLTCGTPTGTNNGITLAAENITSGTLPNARTAGSNLTLSSLNVTAGNINITNTGSCIYLPGGGRICGNTTTVSIIAP